MLSLFKGKPPQISLESLVIPAGGTLVLRASKALANEEVDAVCVAVQRLVAANPGCSIVVLPRPADWDVVTIGAPV